MAKPEEKRIFFTNARVYFNIAREAVDRIKKDREENIHPKPNGKPGFVIKFDPDQRSFKDALVAIVFSGVYIDAILHILIHKKLGADKCRALDYKTYEQKLQALGCADTELLNDIQNFRKARREVVHEKAFFDDDSFRIAQEEALFSLDVAMRIQVYFGIK